MRKSKYNRNFSYKGKEYYLPYFQDKYGRQKNLSKNQRQFNKILKDIENKIKREEEYDIGEIEVSEILQDLPSPKKMTKPVLDIAKKVYHKAATGYYTFYDTDYDGYDDYGSYYEEPEVVDDTVEKADMFYNNLSSLLSQGFNENTQRICLSYLDEFYNIDKAEFVRSVENAMDELKELATRISFESKDVKILTGAATHFVRLVSGGEYGDLPMDDIEEAAEMDIYERRYGRYKFKSSSSHDSGR